MINLLFVADRYEKCLNDETWKRADNGKVVRVRHHVLRCLFRTKFESEYYDGIKIYNSLGYISVRLLMLQSKTRI